MHSTVVCFFGIVLYTLASRTYDVLHVEISCLVVSCCGFSLCIYHLYYYMFVSDGFLTCTVFIYTIRFSFDVSVMYTIIVANEVVFSLFLLEHVVHRSFFCDPLSLMIIIYLGWLPYAVCRFFVPFTSHCSHYYFPQLHHSGRAQ